MDINELQRLKQENSRLSRVLAETIFAVGVTQVGDCLMAGFTWAEQGIGKEEFENKVKVIREERLAKKRQEEEALEKRFAEIEKRRGD